MTYIPKETSISSSPVLIIEDSKATSMLIEEFLNSLGYHDIRIVDSGKDGMETFDNLLNAKIHPIVFLDYNLSDVDAGVILPHLLSRKPDTKIILTTALEKTDQVVKNVIMKGAYQYLQKPVRFADVQRAIKIIEEEAEATENENLKAIERIDSLLKTSFVTLNKISELCNVKREKVEAYLKEQESKHKVACLDTIEEDSCNRCGSVLLKSDESAMQEGKYHCLRCNNDFPIKDAHKTVTKAYRTRLQFNLKDSSDGNCTINLHFSDDNQ